MNGMDLNMLGIKNKNTSMKEENFYVGDGFLSFHNYFLPMNAVSMVKLTEDIIPDMTLGIILTIFGFVFLFLPLLLVKILSVFFIFIGGASVCLSYWKNKNKQYYLTIYINNGNVLSFAHKNSEFILKIMEVIKNCIKDQSMSTYIDMRQEHIEHNIGEMNMFYKNESNVNSVNTFTNGNNSNVSGVAFGDNNNNNNNNSINIITNSEWQQLSEYFEKRKQDFEEGDYRRGICNRIAGYAKSKDAGKLKTYLQQVGGTLKSIVTGVAAKGVTNIIVKLMRL